ncbi:MAG: SLC13 family permease, partial [Rhodobacteraceae bacterium]|nr:SLC13 family permease [Paracoccaceae bacterium]
MFGFEIAASLQPLVALAILVVMFTLFVRETYPVEVTAIGGAATMLVLGILPIKDSIAVLSNAAPWTIVLMFLIMGGLVRTGAVEMVIRIAGRHVGNRPKMTIFALFSFIAVVSAFMNNTPLVAVMIPVVMQIAVRLGTAPSKLLIPLSYMTVLGGMIAIIGTSTNLLVDGLAAKAGLAHFSIFEIAPLGIALTVAGGAFLAVTSRYLLPVRQSMSTLLNDRRKMKYFTEVAVPEDSPLIGQAVLGVDLFNCDGVRLIDVLRGDVSLRRDLQPVILQAGDRVVLRTEMTELLGLQQRKDLHLVDKLSSMHTETVEVLISPGCRMEGRRLGELRLRRRYGVYVLAAHRRSQNIGRQLDDLVVRVGDTLLLEGATGDIQRLAADMDLVDISRPSIKPFRRAKAPIAIGVLVLVVTLSA